MFIDLNKALLAMTFAIAACLSSQAYAADDDKVDTTKKPDNTATNVRDRDKDQVTAGDQKENKADIEITANIRRAVVKDNSLSTSAHNIKIVTINGVVTLKGPVKSEAEKTAIEKIAIGVAGDKNVRTQIDIAP